MQYILNDNRESEIQLSGVSDNISFSGDITLRSIGITALDVPQRELDALVALYNSTSGDSWTDKTNWLQTGTVNDWFGITVSGGHVTEISLNNNNLNGSMGTVLPPLGGYLTTLDLSDNPNLTYPYLGLQTALATIDISNCGLGSASVAARLAEVVANGVSAGTLDIGGSNSSPNPAGVTSLLALEDDSWTLTYSTVIMENTGDFFAIMADGSATIRSSATDISGQETKYLVAYDGTNDKYAFAFGHAADDAEAGDTIASDPCSSDATGTGWTAINSTLTFDTDHYRITRTTSSPQIPYKLTNQNEGELIKLSVDLEQGSATGVNAKLRIKSITQNETAGFNLTGDYVTYTYYLTLDSTGSWYYAPVSAISVNGNYINMRNYSVLKLTALGTDALQLRSAATGSTRNWTSIESGFDPNTISKIEVFLG